MNYLICLFECSVVGKSCINLLPRVLYKVEDFCNNNIFFGNKNEVMFFKDIPNSRCVQSINYNGNNYYVVFPNKVSEVEIVQIKHGTKTYTINIGRYLKIFANGVEILNKEVQLIKYSHYQNFNNNLLLFFSGDRNYIVVINDEEVLFASNYDEINSSEEEKVFMCKLYDCLNHGSVCEVGKSVNKYLVYLDDGELNLKSEFCGCVFLDCLLAGNYNYCNALLDEKIKQQDVENIKEFFPLFDDYFCVEENVFILKNKNALAGICKFEVENVKITNIIHFQ